jgi:hypothetical protein
MKQVIKLSPDMIDQNDNRFDLPAIKKIKHGVAPNTLPLFWKSEGAWVECTDEVYDQQAKEVSGLAFPVGTSYEEALRELCEYLELNIFDISRILHKLDEHVISCDRKTWSAFLEIPFTQWDKIKEINSMSLEWKIFFLSKNTPLKRILSFDDKELRQSLTEILTLNPGINILEQIAILIKEIAFRDQLSYSDIMSMEIIKTVQENDEKSSLKLQTIRLILSEIRYPVISKYRAELNERSANLNKLKNLQIGIDSSFETNGIEIKYLMTNLNDIDNLQQWLENNKKQIERILELQKGDI